MRFKDFKIKYFKTLLNKKITIETFPKSVYEF
jgi:hypothetical protein